MLFSFFVLFALIFVNGFSDAPNSVASAIVSYAIPPKRAIALAALFDMLGVIIFYFLSPSVAYTCGSIANFTHDPEKAILAGMSASVIYALLAWKFGFPTSESHAMSAAVSGAAFFSGGSVSAEAWKKIFIGFLLYSLLAFFISPIISFLAGALLKRTARHRRIAFLSRAQIFFCLLCAFMHGAQDGQKFIGMMMLFSGGRSPNIFSVFLCSATLSLGTLSCSEKIIKTTAVEMARPDMREGFSADAASFMLMLTASLLGIPVSTSNIKNSAILGVKAFSESGKPDIKKAVSLILIWLMTFPVCFILGGVLSYIYTF